MAGSDPEEGEVREKASRPGDQDFRKPKETPEERYKRFKEAKIRRKANQQIKLKAENEGLSYAVCPSTAEHEWMLKATNQDPKLTRDELVALAKRYDNNNTLRTNLHPESGLKLILGLA